MVAAYFLIPLLPLLGSFSTHFDAFLLICSFLFGFLQFSFQPSLSKEMKRHYNKQDNQVMLECWDSGKHVGRILGFVFMQVVIINFLFSWEASMIILMAATLVIILLIYYYCDYSLGERAPERKPDTADITTGEFLSYAKQLMKMPTTRYYIILTCFYKSLAYNFIYWISTFLFGFNYPQLSGKASLAFIIPIFVGNFLVGKMHEDAIADQESLTNSNIFLILAGLLTFGGLAFLTSGPVNYIQFVITIMLEGFLIGGFYNILAANRGLCGEFDPRQKDMFDTFLKAVVNFSSALVALAIGITLNFKLSLNHSNVDMGIFEVMKVVSLLAIVAIILWIFAIYNKIDGEEQEDDWYFDYRIFDSHL